MNPRSTPTLALHAAAGLAVLLLFAGVSRADASVLSEDVDGHGRTETDARRDAMEKAREQIVALLKERRPDIRRLPTDDELRRANLTREVRHDSDFPSERLGPHHRVTVRVEVTERDLGSMLQLDRLQQRHLIAAKIVGILTVLLALFAAFFRLEDVTRGYYTGMLRLGLALSLILLAGAARLIW